MMVNWEGRHAVPPVSCGRNVVQRDEVAWAHLDAYVGRLDRAGRAPSDMLACWDGVLRLLIGSRCAPAERYSHLFESRHIHADEASVLLDIARECNGLRGRELAGRLQPILAGHAERVLAAMRADESPCYYYGLNGRVVYEDPRGKRVVDPAAEPGDSAADREMADLRFGGAGELEFLSFAEARERLERGGIGTEGLFFREDDAASAFVTRERFARGRGPGSPEPEKPPASQEGKAFATFRFEDITDELLESVVYYHFGKPSPHIDSAGSIDMLTEDGRLYTIDCCRRGEGFELPYRKWHELFPVIDETGSCGRWSDTGDKRMGVYGTPSSGDRYVVGNWGTAYFGGEHLVRRDYYPRFLEELASGRWFGHRAAAVAALGLDPEECLANRVMYEKSLEARAREEAERDERSRHWESVRLAPGDLEWTEAKRRSDAPDEASGFRGCYALLYKENYQGNLFATMWSIVPQLDTDMYDGPESRPDLYHVYHRVWHQVGGPVKLQAGYNGMPNDKGDFVRTCRTLEGAKELAMRRNDEGLGWGGYSKENLVDPVTRQLVFGGEGESGTTPPEKAGGIGQCR